tara:strand:- start:569 stop:1387 length:819 start_codon:yes stop_codon:yes gene_type:complete
MLVLNNLSQDYYFCQIDKMDSAKGGVFANIGIAFGNTEFDEKGNANIILLITEQENYLKNSYVDNGVPIKNLFFSGIMDISNGRYYLQTNTNIISIESGNNERLRDFLNASIQSELTDKQQIFLYQLEFSKDRVKKIEFKKFETKKTKKLEDAPFNKMLYLEAIPEFEKLVYKLMKNQSESPQPQPIITDDISDELKKLLDKVAEDDGQESTSIGPPPEQVFAKPIVGDIIQLGGEFGKVTLVENDTIQFETLTKEQASEILNSQFKELQNN